MSLDRKMSVVTLLALLNGALVSAAGAGVLPWFIGVLFAIALPFFVAMAMLFGDQT